VAISGVQVHIGRQVFGYLQCHGAVAAFQPPAGD
jgi:hypothetical protein